MLIGHRGAAGSAPENTVAAFKDGRSSGADFFEIDVQLSADGVPFLFHDNTPARTTNVEEVFPGREDDPITSFTWDELQQLVGTVPDAATLAQIATFADSFGTNYRTLDEAGAQRVKDAGLGLGVYTVNSTEAYEQSVDLGVDRITGDFPIQFSRHERGLKVFPQNAGVRIAESVNDVPGADLQPETGEHVVLENTGRRTVDVSGWLIRDAANNILRVGEGYELDPGEQLRVYTGPGTDAEDAYYNDGTANVLNNGGDSVALWSANGTLQDTFAN